MDRKSLKELKKIVIEDIAHQNDYIEGFEGNENPQIKEMYNNSLIRKQALEDVLQYIVEGSKYQFNKNNEVQNV